MRYKVTFECSKWIVRDTYRNRVVDLYDDEKVARKVADCFENINMLSHIKERTKDNE